MCKLMMHDGPVRMDDFRSWRCHSCDQEWDAPNIPALILGEESYV